MEVEETVALDLNVIQDLNVGNVETMTEDITEAPENTINILVIDDDPESKRRISLALRSAEIRTLSASDCYRGLSKLDYEKTSMVILSDTLPNIARICAKISSIASIPIILTGTDKSDVAWARAVSLGADAYLRKPVGKKEIAARVKAIIRRYKSE